MRYIIDVTQLVHWPGNLTGIPRVMDELAIRFHTHHIPNAVYVSWVKELGKMCEIDFVKTRPHRSNGIDYIKNGPATSTSATTTTQSMLKRIGKKVAIKTHFDRTQMFKRVIGTAHNLEVQNYKPYSPEESDKFLILWGEWWDQNYLDLLKQFVDCGVDLFPLCHDVLPMVVPQFSGNSRSLEDFAEQIFPISKQVIITSEATRHDLTKWMKTHEFKLPKLSKFRLGESFSAPKTTSSDKFMHDKYQIVDDFIICVGTIEPRKNHMLLSYIYKLASSRSIALPHLYIIGRVGHDVENIIKFIKEDPEINSQISILNDVNDSELNWFYKNTRFAIQPSWYEGWGMPIVESIVKGNPAICSNTSSMTEIAEDCVTHFNPASPDEALNAIMEMNQPGVLAQYRAQCQKYHQHSWDDSFKQIISILNEE